MPTTTPCSDRARRALAAAGRDPGAPVRRATSNANEAWIGDDFVLRVNARGDIGRLAREARVAAALAPAVRYPGVLAQGDDGEIEWIISPRVPGTDLSRVWPGLSTTDRGQAMRELASCLAALHATEAAGLPEDRDLLPPHVLPLDRFEEQLARVRAMEHMDAGMMDEVLAYARGAWGAFDTRNRGLVHGDPHLENVLWHEGHVTGLLDLEWARRSWIEVDLEILLSFFAAPWWFVAEEYEDRARAEDYADAPSWLADAYPAWFGHPRLRERLCVLSLSRQLGHYADDPPRGPRDRSDVRDRRNHIQAMLDGTSAVQAWGSRPR